MKALHLLVSEMKNLKFAFFVPMFKIVTPGPVSLRSTRRCCIPNIKTLWLPVSKKKNFEDGLLCSYVPSYDHGVGPASSPGSSYALTL